eukprot:CAMPEP_0117444130 /NCGR_PEP_ID=MMETSP0759-20121206/5070_1 /TAXON_ID=63605 /ORGANISM="Percolomonas cosmopolitus, Strain WS" /LENGTH=255 /DNA_ID=CAMNT_0005236163 /DNA_START=399 /DNA_END=1166 /DNA_ORIENTATION=+
MNRQPSNQQMHVQQQQQQHAQYQEHMPNAPMPSLAATIQHQHMMMHQMIHQQTMQMHQQMNPFGFPQMPPMFGGGGGGINSMTTITHNPNFHQMHHQVTMSTQRQCPAMSPRLPVNHQQSNSPLISSSNSINRQTIMPSPHDTDHHHHTMNQQLLRSSGMMPFLPLQFGQHPHSSTLSMRIPEAKYEVTETGDYEGPDSCKICFSNPIRTAIIDCGHSFACVTCCRRILLDNTQQKKCSICGQTTLQGALILFKS